MTIFGAPCVNVFAPFTLNELRTNYMGCQLLPPALRWKIEEDKKRLRASTVASRDADTR